MTTSLAESEPDCALADAAISLDELGARIVGMAGRLASATCRWLLLVAEFDTREGCAQYGLGTTARWLAHHCGLAHRTAVEHVRVARSLASFPALAQTMAAGRLSYSQVRAISRVLSEGEHDVVADLIQLAEHGTAAQLETVTRGMRTVERNTADDGPPPEERVQHGWTAGSQWRLSAQLNPERGVLVQRAIDELARAEGITQAQALLRMAEISLVVTADAGRSPRPLRGDERAAIVIHVQAAELAASELLPAAPRSADSGSRSAERGRSMGRLNDGPGLPRAVLKRLLCSGRIRTLVHDELDKVSNIGRSHRTVTDKQFRALLIRDRHCTHPGCTSKAGLEAHHVKHWLAGGRTELRNLVLLCEAHHHALHDGEFSIDALGGERFRFVRADGRVLLAHVHQSDYAGASADDDSIIRAEHVAPDAARTRWGGERLDREWVISVLAQRRKLA